VRPSSNVSKIADSPLDESFLLSIFVSETSATEGKNCVLIRVDVLLFNANIMYRYSESTSGVVSWPQSPSSHLRNTYSVSSRCSQLSWKKNKVLCCQSLQVLYPWPYDLLFSFPTESLSRYNMESLRPHYSTSPKPFQGYSSIESQRIIFLD
jgi:hypothetical protein